MIYSWQGVENSRFSLQIPTGIATNQRAPHCAQIVCDKLKGTTPN